MEQGPVEYVQSLTSSIKKRKKKGNDLGNSKTQGLKMLYFGDKVAFQLPDTGLGWKSAVDEVAFI